MSYSKYDEDYLEFQLYKLNFILVNPRYYDFETAIQEIDKKYWLSASSQFENMARISLYLYSLQGNRSIKNERRRTFRN
ncbi:hypothetical protein [Chryseobacterium proteolyticum]|uniref:hypothetical protein n=1 Tax=Chryseobacterium proteolyticum TaxID=118127 RepID=UPI0039831723